MDKLNVEGVERDQLPWVLTQARFVRVARRIDACLLCRRAGVNEAGLCDACTALLSDHELSLAEKWFNGAGP